MEGKFAGEIELVVMMPAVMMVVVPAIMVTIEMEAPAMVSAVIMMTTVSVVATMVMVPATDVLQRQSAVSLRRDAIGYRKWRCLRWEREHPQPKRHSNC